MHRSTHRYTNIYIYIYIERERERDVWLKTVECFFLISSCEDVRVLLYLA